MYLFLEHELVRWLRINNQCVVWRDDRTVWRRNACGAERWTQVGTAQTEKQVLKFLPGYPIGWKLIRRKGRDALTINKKPIGVADLCPTYYESEGLVFVRGIAIPPGPDDTVANRAEKDQRIELYKEMVDLRLPLSVRE